MIQGQKLIPSVTRVFSQSRDMFIYLQAYPQNDAESRRLVAYATFYRNQAKAFETAPVAVVDPPDAKLEAFPLRFNLSLSKLHPGEYHLQISVLDPDGNKVAFWQAPVMLVP